MGFNLVTKGEGKRERVKSRVAFQRNKTSVRIIISSDIWEAFGATHVAVHIGTGEDEGTVLLSPSGDAHGAFKLSKSGGSTNGYINVSSKYFGGIGSRIPERMTPTQYELTNNCIVAVVPQKHGAETAPASSGRQVPTNDRKDTFVIRR